MILEHFDRVFCSHQSTVREDELKNFRVKFFWQIHGRSVRVFGHQSTVLKDELNDFRIDHFLHIRHQADGLGSRYFTLWLRDLSKLDSQYHT